MERLAVFRGQSKPVIFQSLQGRQGETGYTLLGYHTARQNRKRKCTRPHVKALILAGLPHMTRACQSQQWPAHQHTHPRTGYVGRAGPHRQRHLAANKATSTTFIKGGAPESLFVTQLTELLVLHCG